MSRDHGTTGMFIDTARIMVRGGKGGDGCVSFRREKFVPKGGPDGGDGGDGGSVYLVAQSGLGTLLDLTGRHHYYAENGRPGAGANRSGKSGKDLIVDVPVGTLVYDETTKTFLKDLNQDGARICVAAGGKGGRGNTRFASATNQTPREYDPGLPGGERELRLELKLIADVGLVGLPNAGKSTLLSRLTNARPKIADYPFTTKSPQLGIAELSGFRRLVFADIPGLLEGAHEGVGLGDAFLRHIERTRVIVHLIDLCPPAGSPAPDDAYHVVRNELEKYSPALASRPEILVGNKMDLTDADLAYDLFSQAIGKPMRKISGVTGAGLKELLEVIWREVAAARETQQDEPAPLIDLEAPSSWTIGESVAKERDATTADASDESQFEWHPETDPFS